VSRIWNALKLAERQRAGAANSAEGPAHLLPADGSNGPAQDGADRRSGLRHTHQVSLLIYGSDGERQPFHEEAETVDAHERGCSLDMETVVVRGQRLFLTNMRNQAELECRVVHVSKRVRGRSRVGLEFLAASPEFWFPA
jgi:hypothetical protein